MVAERLKRGGYAYKNEVWALVWGIREGGGVHGMAESEATACMCAQHGDLN